MLCKYCKSVTKQEACLSCQDDIQHIVKSKAIKPKIKEYVLAHYKEYIEFLEGPHEHPNAIFCRIQATAEFFSFKNKGRLL